MSVTGLLKSFSLKTQYTLLILGRESVRFQYDKLLVFLKKLQ